MYRHCDTAPEGKFEVLKGQGKVTPLPHTEPRQHVHVPLQSELELKEKVTVVCGDGVYIPGSLPYNCRCAHSRTEQYFVSRSQYRPSRAVTGSLTGQPCSLVMTCGHQRHAGIRERPTPSPSPPNNVQCCSQNSLAQPPPHVFTSADSLEQLLCDLSNNTSTGDRQRRDGRKLRRKSNGVSGSMGGRDKSGQCLFWVVNPTSFIGPNQRQPTEPRCGRRDNIGHRLLQKHGWKLGQGLGKTMQGWGMGSLGQEKWRGLGAVLCPTVVGNQKLRKRTGRLQAGVTQVWRNDGIMEGVVLGLPRKPQDPSLVSARTRMAEERRLLFASPISGGGGWSECVILGGGRDGVGGRLGAGCAEAGR
ncbi:hypothetical protein JZ751_013224 [Albula glossodonta]|uniref:G-patch domain-containing protein n=1 Tax=Albula glossodonta TaxID=121402 RepID=A0A8T2NSD3_9TELE|nr:hypothetical protein JZ751_013224 [Albula glossodonta]